MGYKLNISKNNMEQVSKSNMSNIIVLKTYIFVCVYLWASNVYSTL